MRQTVYQQAGNPFASYNPQPIVQGGAAMGEAYASIGQDIATALEKRRKSKEKKAELENLTTDIMNNPEIFGEMSEEEAGVAAKVLQDNPAIAQMKQQAKQHQDRNALSRRQVELMEQSAKDRAAQAEREKIATQFQQLTNLAGQRMNDGQAIPLELGNQLEENARVLGLPKGSVDTLIKQSASQLRKQREQEDLSIRKTEANIDYMEGQLEVARDAQSLNAWKANWMRFKEMQAMNQGVPVGKQIKMVQDHLDLIESRTYKIGNVVGTIPELMKNPDTLKKLELSGPNSQVGAAYQQRKLLLEDLASIDRENSKIPITMPDGSVKKVSPAQAAQIKAAQEAAKSRIKRPPTGIGSNAPSYDSLDPASMVF